MGDPIRPAAFTVNRLRWWVAGALMLLSVLNYVDRQTLAIVATTVQADLGLSDLDYARVSQAFLVTYTACYLLSGRLVDRLGPRLAEALFVAWWSIATMLTGLATGLVSLMIFRALLGAGEPGHYAVSAKVVAQWFPPGEKAVAVGMYVMGGTLGAALAAPLVVALTAHLGWRAAFAATGAVGLTLALAWWVFYRPPAGHPWLGDGERRFLEAESVLAPGPAPAAAPVPWTTLLRSTPVWLLLAAKAATDSVWYFYLFWFAKYLQAERGFTQSDVVWTGVVFLAADAGCLLGGWASGALIRRGLTPVAARLAVMAAAAAVLGLHFTLPWLPGRALPLAAACVFACAIMVWFTNSVTLPIDLLPPGSVGSAQGLIGTGGSLGGAVSQGAIGYLVTHASYAWVFAATSVLHPAALLLLLVFLPRSPERRGQP